MFLKRNAIENYIFLVQGNVQVVRNFMFNYLCRTKVNLENDCNFYSACSNPPIVKSYAALLAGG